MHVLLCGGGLAQGFSALIGHTNKFRNSLRL